MRLGTEQLLEAFGLTYESTSAMREKSDVKIVTDTISPSSSHKVEENVSVVLPVHPSKDKLKSDTGRIRHLGVDSEVSAKEPIELVDIVKPHTQQHKVEDTIIHRNADKVAKDSSRVYQPSVVNTPVAIVEEPSIEYYSIDSIDSQLPIDSTEVDTVIVAEPKLTTTSLLMEGQKLGNPLPMSLDRSDGIFALLVVCFLLLAHVYNGGVTFFKENILLVFSSSKSEKLEAQTTTKEMFYSFFLVFLAVLLISISLYEAFDRFMPVDYTEKRPFATIGAFIVLILLFILAKITLNKLIGYIFDIDKKLNTWNRSYLVLLSMFGLLCFLPTLMLVYSSLWHSIIIGFVLVLFLIVQIILFLRIIVFFISRKFNFLYLIAYLCTIEILPYIFLGVGLVYLYRIDIFNTIL